MTPPRTCPQCGRTLTASAAGLCPQCLLNASLDESGDPAAGGGAALTTAARGLLIRYVGDYEIERELGAGGMGVVFRARQRTLRRTVALKLLNAGALASAELVQRFRNEAEAAAALSHPHIVGIYEVGEHAGQQYFSMEWVDGQSLATALGGRPMEVRQAARLALKLARALQHAHQHGVLHRDVKPGNILIDTEGEPHLSDFGLAQFRERAIHLTQTGTPMGTPAYMSPEQARGEWKAVTTATDVWGLAAVLYELLTGQPPFTGPTALETVRQVEEEEPRPPRQLNAAVTTDLETICLKGLQKDPNRRYLTAAALADDLERCLEGRPIQARPVGSVERLWMWARRKPAAAALYAMSVLAALSVLSTGLLWSRSWVRERLVEEAQVRLQLAHATVLAAPPRPMGWSSVASNHLAAASRLTGKPSDPNVLAGTLQGWEARLLGERWAPGNRQLVFGSPTEPGGARLLLAGSGSSEAWSFAHPQATNGGRPVPYPGRPLAHPPGTLVQLLEGSNERLIVWSSVGTVALGTISLPPGLALPGGGQEPLAALSTSEARVALVLRDGRHADTIACWELPSGRLLTAVSVGAVMAGHRSLAGPSRTGAAVEAVPKATALALSPDGRVVAVGVGAPSNAVLLYDLGGDRLLRTFRISNLPIRCLAFGDSRRRKVLTEGEGRPWLIAAGDSGGSIGVMDTGLDGLTALLRGAHLNVECLAFSPDAMMLASGGRGQIRLWDLAMNQALLQLDRGDYCDALAFSPDGRHLAASARAGGTNAFVHLWELSNGRGIANLRGPSGGVTRPTFSLRGDRLACVGLDWQIGVWDTGSAQLLWLLEGPQGETADNCALAFSADARLLAVSAAYEAQLWDLATGRCVWSRPLPPGLSDALSFASTNELYLWRTETLQGDRLPVRSAPWKEHPRVVRLRNLLAERPLDPLHTITNFGRGIIANQITSDGKYLSIEGLRLEKGEEERGLLVVESPSGRVLDSLRVQSRGRWSQVVLGAASQHMAISLDETNWTIVRLPDMDQRRRRIDPPLALGPYPELWASGGPEARELRLRDERRGLRVTFPSGYLWNVAFDPTGHWLAWGTETGSLILCDLDEMARRLRAAEVVVPEP